ncbi:MAG: threonylcarbamoyl-AMP synthase, partial [Oscillospiraceae bacterium]|nr:threonylcarbamoyl-AMP synthase [Oscillospiraceae bacterium]
MKTVLTSDDLELASEIIKSGGLVGVPTETVYGLAANGLDEKVVAEIYRVKGRPETKPISLLVSGMEGAESFCKNIPEAAYVLAEKFWPGPLTMVLEKRDNVPDIVTAGGKTVGVRCPAHEKTLEIIRRCDLPLATPSANISDMPSPKCARDVLS